MDETFGSEGKQRMLQMVNELEAALGDDIRSLDWMSPETKPKAEEKLKAIPEYADKEIVSRITNKILTPTPYSEI